MNSSPAISLHDFERFYLHPERRTPIPRRQSQVLAIDIRSAVDFDRAHLASSCFNLPADEYFQRGQLHPEALALVKRVRMIYVTGCLFSHTAQLFLAFAALLL